MKVKDVQHGKTTRKSFARIEEILEMPNLIEVQKKSYEWFLDQGLREVFDDTASITDYTGQSGAFLPRFFDGRGAEVQH